MLNGKRNFCWRLHQHLKVPFFATIFILALFGNVLAQLLSGGSSQFASASKDQQQQQQGPQWAINSYSPEFGVYIGPMRSPDQRQQIMGHAFAVNESAIQLVNFTFDGDMPDTFFWLDQFELPTRDGIRLRTFEYGYSPIGSYGPKQQILLVLPEDEESGHLHRISQFHSLSLFSLNGDIPLGIVRIPDNLVVPKTQLLPDELRGSRYDVQSGPVQILDTRTIKIFGFIFLGDKAPDGYFYVGRGLNVSKESGVKAAIRGRDTFQSISPMNERYTGGKDIYVELPEGYDIHHIDWLSVYCLRFEVDYGHIFIRNISPMIPPFVPIGKRFEDELAQVEAEHWQMSNLLGLDSQLNFTFQLGPSGGNRGYQFAMRIARAPKYVWYVNGYMAAELYLKRGVTYTFIVEGGHNTTVPELHNSLYLTDSPYGGYAKLSNEERQSVIKFTEDEVGRLCRWTQLMDVAPQTFSSFVDFRDTLRLECDESDQPGILTYTPGKDTPNTLYYASYNNYQMGGRIHVVDEFPGDLKDIVVEPYRYDAKRHQEKMELTRDNGSTGRRRGGTWSLEISCFAAIFLALFLTIFSP